jgi:endoglucanase
MFAKRYRSEGEHLLFELLNEVVEATPAEWNALIARAVRAIRTVEPRRWVVVGGIQYNSINALEHIAILDDPRIVYTFHFYSPILFTHQKAGWNQPAMAYDKFTGGAQVPYPGEIPRLAEFVEANPRYKGEAKYAGRRLDKDWMRTAVEPAVRFLRERRKPLYCGEYGVIRHASEESRERWYADFCDLMRQSRIGRAAWSYKDGSFGFVDRNSGRPLQEAVVKLAARRW